MDGDRYVGLKTIRSVLLPILRGKSRSHARYWSKRTSGIQKPFLVREAPEPRKILGGAGAYESIE